MNNLPYIIKVSKRARSIRLAVYNDGRVLLTIPRYVSTKQAENFFEEKKTWVEEKLRQFQNRPQRVKLGSKKEYLELKKEALALAMYKIEYFNKIYNLKYGDIKIRDQKSRWGSCSRRGNLTFNYRIALLSEELTDYVIVHELCHIKEFNHSKSFWNLVGLSIPNYPELKKKLRMYTLK